MHPPVAQPEVSAAVDAGSPDVQERIEAEATVLLYRSSGFGLLSNLLLATVLVAGTFGVYPLSFHLKWLAAIVVVSLARWFLAAAFKRAQPSVADLPKWRNAFVVGVGLIGVIWGAAGWSYFASDTLLPRLLVVLILAGINAGAARSFGPVPLAYCIYVLTTLCPLLIRFALMPIDGSWLLAISTVIYALFLLNTLRLHHADLQRLHRLIFTNEELVATMRREKTKAEEKNQAKSDFLATMSHEIRTPMNGILGMLQVMQDAPVNETQREQLSIATNSADSLMRLLNDILDFSKIESGMLDFEAIPLALADTVEEVAALLRPRANNKKLELELDLDPSLPAYVTSDPVRLKQVLLNLTGNAIKFTEKGSVKIQVRLLPASEASARVSFSIRDTGIGIDRDTQEKLFRLFTQGDSTMSRRFGGTGLGLAISQKLVERMGGRIAVASEPGKGSTFSFELAFTVASAPKPSTTRSPFAGNAPMAGRLLVIEDDRVNQRVIQALLGKLGLESVVVGNGLDAVKAAISEPWAAVLMDCQMPGMDGFEATRRIRQLTAGRHLPIIAITANARPEDRAACEAAGMDDFLPKPIRQKELKACLSRWLNTQAVDDFAQK
jgi:signal transduction histidine kinase/CheY-like chemotaxis protein